MSRTHRLRIPAVIAVTVVASLGVASAASAHIDPDPTEVNAGTEATVGFTVEHGCEGSPTVKLEMQVPETITTFEGVDVAGFTASTDGQVVTWSGGTLGPDTEQTFELTFTAPAQDGEASFPIIQTCEEGSIDWIEEEVEGQPEPEHPAPVVAIVGVAPSTTTTAAETTTTAAGSTTETTAPEASTTTAAPTVVDQGAAEDDDSGSAIAIVVAIIAVLALVIMGVLLYARSRKGGDEAEADAPAADAAAGADPAAPAEAEPTDPEPTDPEPTDPEA